MSILWKRKKLIFLCVLFISQIQYKGQKSIFNYKYFGINNLENLSHEKGIFMPVNTFIHIVIIKNEVE